jgi:chromosome partitioning protein
VDLIAGSIRLKNSDSVFTELGKEYILQNALKDLKKKYDYVIIDTPPTLSLLTLNALTCSDDVIIPMQADIFSMQGLSQLIKQIEAIRQYTNSKIKVAGVLLTKYSERNILTRDLYKQIQKVTDDLQLHLFKTTIRDAVLVKEAQAQKTNIIDADAKANVTKDYIKFINEYMKGDK